MRFQKHDHGDYHRCAHYLHFVVFLCDGSYCKNQLNGDDIKEDAAHLL